jgi:hypothetical protein
MGNLTLARTVELRWKAAQWRRYAAETNQPAYVEMMDGAASDLECEAGKLERHARISEEIFLLAS